MSKARLWTEEQFNCPVCLDLPSDPVTIPCGHSYCMECITDFWDSERKKTGSCSCPECRQTFAPRPRLCRNTMLAEAVEQLRLGSLSSKARESIRDARRAAAAASERSAGGGRGSAGTQLPASSAPCDRCVEPKAAVKTCLTCMASFCGVHLKPHETQAKLRSHELIAPTADLTQKICPEHKYLQEFYCRSCQTYICWLCTSNLHKEHESVSTQAERAEKQKTLLAVQTENLQKLQDREREVKDMKKVLETLKCSSDTASEETESVLDELQRSVQRLADLIQQVMSTSGQEKIEDTRQVVDKLETEIRQLRKKDSDLKDLVTCQDNIYFLKTYQCLCSPEISDLGSVTANPDVSFRPVQNIVSDLREKVENMCNQELEKINKSVFNTTPFMISERQSGAKTGIFKLFSGIGGKTASSRAQGPPALPSVSVRGSAANSTRARTNYNREERERANNRSERPRRDDGDHQERENNNTTRSESGGGGGGGNGDAETRRLKPSQQSTHRRENQEQEDTWSLSSVRFRGRTRRDESEEVNGETQGTPDTVMIRQQPERQPDTWSVSSIRSIRGREKKEEKVAGNADTQSQQQVAAARHQPERQSDRWSLSSLLPKNRKKRQESVKQATPIQPESPQDQWGNQTEVNTGLFLDSPSADPSIIPTFPPPREIHIHTIHAPEPRTRDEFLQYACDLTFDPNTAHRRLVLSEDDTKATLQAAAHSDPDVPERFDSWTQVLSLQLLSSARCYWEVEWRGRGSSVGVASASMPRKGADARAGLGYNDQSWSLELSDMFCAAMHANQKQEIPVTYCPRVGVFLNQEEESLAFYGVDDVLVHLHTFHGVSSSRPLFAAFGVGSGVGVGLDFAMGNFSASTDSIKICAL